MTLAAEPREPPPPIRLGMIGGGQGAVAGIRHRMAAKMCGHYELVAGCFAGDPHRSKLMGAELRLPENRVYDTFWGMATREPQLNQGAEAVAIVTPNHLHAPMAAEFLRRNIHVFCETPVAATLAEAKWLLDAAHASEALFFLAHQTVCYPMVQRARAMIAAGDLGDIRVVQIEYTQDWLATAREHGGDKQAQWRTDPEQAGSGGSISQGGMHAFQLAQFVTGLSTAQLCADMSSFVEGRVLDDNAHVLLQFEGGARGMLWSSQIAPGRDQGPRMRVIGERAALEWSSGTPDCLWNTPTGEATCRMTPPRDGPFGLEGTMDGGYPALYGAAAQAIHAHARGEQLEADLLLGVADGLQGLAFAEACIQSFEAGSEWVPLRSL